MATATPDDLRHAERVFTDVFLITTRRAELRPAIRARAAQEFAEDRARMDQQRRNIKRLRTQRDRMRKAFGPLVAEFRAFWDTVREAGHNPYGTARTSEITQMLATAKRALAFAGPRIDNHAGGEHATLTPRPDRPVRSGLRAGGEVDQPG
jgi:hypothetical protein